MRRVSVIAFLWQAKVFSDTTCQVCQQRLDLPAVHFMCGHSFHQGCLVDNDQDCSVCAANNRKVMERKHALEKSVDSQDKFFAALTEGDGFQVCESCLCRLCMFFESEWRTSGARVAVRGHDCSRSI